MEWRRLSAILRTKSIVARTIGILLVASLLVPSSSKGCDFPAIYNFGDSNSDTGSVSAAFGHLHPPYGETFFRKPSGRYSDGRLMIDFIAEKLGLPFLSSYLDAMESIFSHGANFAASGATIQPVDGKLYGAGFNPLSLTVQLSQFEQLIDRTTEIYSEGRSSEITSRLPKPEDLSKALYMLDIGQNDLHYGLVTTTVEQVNTPISNLINQFSSNLEPEDADQIGCIKSYNEVAQEFNRQLEYKISQLRTQLRDARLVYVDIYSAQYALISEAQKHGFGGPFGYCCGHLGEDNSVFCWDKPAMNGSGISIPACSDPSRYISWDSIHFTEAGNHSVASRIMEGSLSDPQVHVTGDCH